MKVIVLLVFLAVGMIPLSAYADSEFVYKQLPGKLLEYTDGTIQVFVESGGLMVPTTITGLKTTSTDIEIIRIVGMEPANKYITNIQIEALKPGTANIILAAPGFMSKEVPITVFNSNNFPTQIQMKITPDDFPVDGPRHGFIGIELLTTSGQPSQAEYDTLIKFSTPNTDMIKLKQQEVLIKEGEYFAINEFDVLTSGEPIIFAETDGMKRISQFINIQEAAEPYKIKVYAHPSTFTSYSNPTAFLVVQLQDDDGVPVTAEKDVHVSITTTNPDSSINTSGDFKEVLFSEETLTIEKGTYVTTTSFTTRPDLGDYTESDFQTYTISVSTDDYISTSTSIQVIHERVGDEDSGQIKNGVLLGEGPAFFESVPFLTTGNKELIGVLYLEATVPIVDKLDYLKPGSATVIETIFGEATIPVMTKTDLELNIASSNLNSVNVINPIVPKGSNSVLVFGNTGTVAPLDCNIEFYLTDNDGVSIVSGDPFGPVKGSLSLTVEPMIPKILAGSKFPIIGYMIEGSSSSDGSTCYSTSEDSGRFGITQFTEDTILTFSADELLEIDSAIIKWMYNQRKLEHHLFKFVELIYHLRFQCKVTLQIQHLLPLLFLKQRCQVLMPYWPFKH
jgi:hypothetical protein